MLDTRCWQRRNSRIETQGSQKQIFTVSSILHFSLFILHFFSLTTTRHLLLICYSQNKAFQILPLRMKDAHRMVIGQAQPADDLDISVCVYGGSEDNLPEKFRIHRAGTREGE